MTDVVRTRRRKLIVLLGLLTTILAISLLSTAFFIADDSNNSSYLETISNHPLIQTVKEYQDYASKKLSETYKSLFDTEEDDGLENATLFSLVRNEDLDGILASIDYVEKRFNSQFHYPWVFVNDKDFTEEFISKVSELCSGETFFEKIPQEYWSYPDWIDQDKLRQVREEMKSVVKYGGSQSYRHMCRFNSGFFYKMDILQKYDYYWRVEPDIKFVCDVNYDPFKVMKDNGKKYGFNMAMQEFEKSIPTLWQTTKEFFQKNPDLVAADNNMKFISDDNGDTFSLCHFWSNFEIGDLSFFRSAKYESFFEALDKNGGFFYERWGDAPVHTIAASIMLPLSEIQYFDNTGYYHVPNQNCPPQETVRRELNCDCNARKDFSWHKWSCVSRFFLVNDIPIPEGVTPNHSKRQLSEDQIFNPEKLLFADTQKRWFDEL